MLESRVAIVVRSTEIDINGHVNNAKYVEYREWGREDWYERLGLDHATLLAMGAITVTVNLNVNFRRECRQGEALFVVTRPARLGRTSFALAQEIRTEAGESVVEATVTTVTIDPATRRPVPVPGPLAAAFAGTGGAVSSPGDG
jgi:YbgC/YbaW family acyl-CoA thioester hydrolase